MSSGGISSLSTNPIKANQTQSLNQSQPLNPNQHLAASQNIFNSSTNPFKKNYVGLGPNVQNTIGIG